MAFWLNSRFYDWNGFSPSNGRHKMSRFKMNIISFRWNGFERRYNRRPGLTSTKLWDNSKLSLFYMIDTFVTHIIANILLLLTENGPSCGAKTLVSQFRRIFQHIRDEWSLKLWSIWMHMIFDTPHNFNFPSEKYPQLTIFLKYPSTVRKLELKTSAQNSSRVNSFICHLDYTQQCRFKRD